jgi:hypothetical protein
VLADHRIEDKTREQFDLVYQTKVNGLKSLLQSIDANSLRVLGLFSSYTARYGRVGQVDYAMANEVLNKQAHEFANQHPDCQVASFNWGPWDGGLIPLAAGAEFVLREFSQSTSKPVEILVLADRESPNPPIGASQAADFKVAFERTIDLFSAPYLESHVLGGKAVLPVAMIMEWLAHGAIHRNPGLELLGFEDLRVYQGVRLALNDRIALRVLADKPVRKDGLFKVPMRLVRTENSREILHAAGTVVLGTAYTKAPLPGLSAPNKPYSTDLLVAYSDRLFHGAQFRGITAIEGCSADSIAVKARPAPAPSSWMTDPIRGNWLADPLVIDTVLQAIILWSQETHARPCLPCAIGKYHQYVRVFPRNGVQIVIHVRPQSGQLIHSDVEIVDSQGQLIARMENCESVADPSLISAFRNNQMRT